MHLCPLDSDFLHHEGEIVVVVFFSRSVLFQSSVVAPFCRNDLAGQVLQRVLLLSCSITQYEIPRTPLMMVTNVYYCFRAVSRSSSDAAHDRQQVPLTSVDLVLADTCNAHGNVRR